MDATLALPVLIGLIIVAVEFRGGFLLVVQDFDSFGEAITNKLVNEIAAAKPLTRAAALQR